MTPWWDERVFAWLGAVGGGGLGTLAGLLGAAAGVLAPRGLGKWFVVPAFILLAGAGAVSLVAGVVGVAVGQPYHVYFPLLMIGAVLGGVMGGLLPVVLLRYRQAEARRMQAEDLRRG